MTLRVAQINCVMDEEGLALPALLREWPSLPLVAEAAAGAGAEIHVLQSGERTEVHHLNGVTYRLVHEVRVGRGRRGSLTPWRIAEEIRRLKPDVVHFHGLEHPFHLRSACKAPSPVLVQDHASRPSRRRAVFRRWSLKDAAACAFTSAAQAEAFVSAGE